MIQTDQKLKRNSSFQNLTLESLEKKLPDVTKITNQNNNKTKTNIILEYKQIFFF